MDFTFMQFFGWKFAVRMGIELGPLALKAKVLPLHHSLSVWLKTNFNILVSNWGAHLAENWSQGLADADVVNAAPRGFPTDVPLVIKPPTLQWIGVGAKSPRDRRIAYERSRPQLTSLSANRRKNDKTRLIHNRDIVISIFSQFSVFKCLIFNFEFQNF